MAFLVKMKQSNKCGSVRNDEIINLHLGSGTGPSSCKTPATLIPSAQRTNQEKNKEFRNPCSTFNKLYHTALASHAHNKCDSTLQ